MKTNDKGYILVLRALIVSAKNGNSRNAAGLLAQASKRLCDDTEEGELLRQYVQECLGKIKFSFMKGIFPSKKVNEKKTAFFKAFNLSKSNRRPKNSDIAFRNRELTKDYILYICSGKTPEKVIEEIQDKYFKEAFEASDGNKEIGGERTIRRIISENIEEAICELEVLRLGRCFMLDYFVNAINNDLIYSNHEDEKKYASSTPCLKEICKRLQNENKKNNSDSDQNIISILSKGLKRMSSCCPKLEEYIEALRQLKLYFEIPDIEEIRKLVKNYLR